MTHLQRCNPEPLSLCAAAGYASVLLRRFSRLYPRPPPPVPFSRTFLTFRSFPDTAEKSVPGGTFELLECVREEVVWGFFCRALIVFPLDEMGCVQVRRKRRRRAESRGEGSDSLEMNGDDEDGDERLKTTSY